MNSPPKPPAKSGQALSAAPHELTPQPPAIAGQALSAAPHELTPQPPLCYTS